ncbi:hypothetical protein EL22_28155 [Halostagnicola sp. A56]|nr:hypothetical protein EL22_28155 [Halostagnicola sp. A56]
MLSLVFENVVEFYDRTVSSGEEEGARWIYRYLKLAGCILDQYEDLIEAQKLVEDRLISDFYEPSAHMSQALIPKTAELGYPTDLHHNLPTLSADQVWGPHLQEAVKSEFYEDIGEKCIQYHDELKEKSEMDDAK